MLPTSPAEGTPSARPLSEDFQSFLRALLVRTGPGRRGLLDLAEKVRTTARIQMRTAVPDILGKWKVEGHAWMTSCRCQLAVPVTDGPAMAQALASGAPAVLLCAGDLASPWWSRLQPGLERVVAAIHDPKAPSLWFRPRFLWQEDQEAVPGEGVPATLLDLATVFHGTMDVRREAETHPAVRPRLGLCLSGLESAFGAAWWDSMVSELEGAVAARRGSTPVWLMVDTAPGLVSLDDIISALRGRVVGASFCARGYLGSLADIDADRLVPDQPGARSVLEAALRHMVRVCHRRRALALGPLSPGKAARGQVALGLDGARVKSPADVPLAVGAFPEPHQMDTVPPAPMSLAASGQITTAGTREAVATLIQVTALEEEGRGCRLAGGPYLDRSAGRYSRSILLQRMRRKARTQEGDEVTPERVTGWFDEALKQMGPSFAAARAAAEKDLRSRL